MSFDTFLKIAFAVMTIVSYAIYRLTFYKEKVTYKDQRVGVRTKWWRKGVSA